MNENVFAVIYFLFLSNGSVQADIKVIATINTNTARKDEAIDYLIEGLDSFSGDGLKVTAIVVQGKKAKVISCLTVFISFVCFSFTSANKTMKIARVAVGY